MAQMRWYQDVSRAAFDVPRSAGRLRWRLFVKYEDGADRIDQASSSTIEVTEDGRRAPG